MYRLTNSTGNELGVLSSEIDDQDRSVDGVLSVVGGTGRHPTMVRGTRRRDTDSAPAIDGTGPGVVAFGTKRCLHRAGATMRA